HLQRLRTGAKRGQSQTSRWTTRGRILIPPPKARGNGPRLCAEHQPQRHGEATRFGIIQRLWASALAAAGPSDTAAVRWWFQDAPVRPSLGRKSNHVVERPAGASVLSLGSCIHTDTSLRSGPGGTNDNSPAHGPFCPAPESP